MTLFSLFGLSVLSFEMALGAGSFEFQELNIRERIRVTRPINLIQAAFTRRYQLKRPIDIDNSRNVSLRGKLKSS